MAEAARPSARIRCKYLVCVLQESADFPSVVDSLAASLLRRIQKLCDNRGFAYQRSKPGPVVTSNKDKSMGSKFSPDFDSCESASLERFHVRMYLTTFQYNFKVNSMHGIRVAFWVNWL
jgi:hypothetical protein